MKPDAAYARDFIARLSFPRLTGTPGARRAADLVAEELAAVGYGPVDRESFASSFFGWEWYRYFFPVVGALLVAAAALLDRTPAGTLVLLALLVAAVALTLSVTGNYQRVAAFFRYPAVQSENIIARARGAGARTRVIIMAHWDSKSQRFPTRTRIAIIALPALGVLAGIAVLTPLALADLAGWGPFPAAARVCTIVAAVTGGVGLLNFFNVTANDSDGAYDNASGVGILMALARHYAAAAPEGLELWFVATGAEELGLDGAKDFIARHGAAFDRERTYFINLDSLGVAGTQRLLTSYGIVRTHSDPELRDLFFAAARERGIALRRFDLVIGAWSDLMPVVEAGFKGTWIGVDSCLKYSHSPRDTMDLIETESLGRSLDLIEGVIHALGRRAAEN